MLSPQSEVSNVRVSLAENRAYTLPTQVHKIKVLSGGAWVSLGVDDVVVGPNQVVQFHPGRQRVVVTPLGRKRLEFVMSA